MAEHEQAQGQWFVVQALSGQEMKAADSLKRRCQQEGAADFLFQVEVPTEKVSEVRHGRKTTMNRKFFPGYILVRMQLYAEPGQIDPRAWYFIKETQGVIGFIGGERPVALADSEVDAILNQARPGEELPKPKIDFIIGETVTIKDGAFENFEGSVEAVDPTRGKLRLSVVIFGRSTPVEVEYWQVERG
ncbi:MAG: transcription termination/antitermination protein NusG [Lentisphaeria bacterium]